MVIESNFGTIQLINGVNHYVGIFIFILFHTFDIAVIPVPKGANVPYFDALRIYTNLLLGDEGFMVGFPYALGSQMAATNIRPFPMLKKVSFSGSSNHQVPILFFLAGIILGFLVVQYCLRIA